MTTTGGLLVRDSSERIADHWRRAVRTMAERVAAYGAGPLREFDDALSALCGCGDGDGAPCLDCEPWA